MIPTSNKRAELRRQAKEQQKEQVVYHLTHAQLDLMKQQVATDTAKTLEDMVKRARAEAFVLALALPTLYFRNKGWGRKRLTEMGEGIWDLFKIYESGNLGTLEEVVETVNDEVDYKLTDIMKGFE